MTHIEPVHPRRVFVDSGPAGTADPGERLKVFRVHRDDLVPHPSVSADRPWASIPVMTIPPSGVLVSHTTAAMSNVVGLDLTSLSPGADRATYIRGFEGSDLVAVYYAIDELGRVLEGEELEVTGDGQALSMLQGTGKVRVKWGGKNWAPELVERIREAESRFQAVSYRVVASSANPAGNLAKENKYRNIARRVGDDG
jgi:hypothetical protein